MPPSNVSAAHELRNTGLTPLASAAGVHTNSRSVSSPMSIVLATRLVAATGTYSYTAKDGNAVGEAIGIATFTDLDTLDADLGNAAVELRAKAISRINGTDKPDQGSLV